MDRERSFELSARIGRLISERPPVIGYTAEEARRAVAAAPPEEIAQMRRAGLPVDDPVLFFVMEKLLAQTGVAREADDDYLLALFRRARRLDADAFAADGYLSHVRFLPGADGRFELTYSTYERGEILSYDMPDLRAPVIVPALGFFERAVRFPTLCEGGVPWISVCPSEINSMKDDIDAAHGRVLVLGLGLGYYAYQVAEKPEVSEVTVVELRPEVIGLYQSRLRPHFCHAEKIRVVCADALAYLAGVENGRFDVCFADIWKGAVDGAPLYRAIKAHEARLYATEFRYWIGGQIEAYLSGGL